MRSTQTIEGLFEVPLICSKVIAGTLGGLSTLFVIPVTILLTVHYQNFFKNMTTNERFSKTANRANDINGGGAVSFLKPQQNFILNCGEMCFNTKSHRRNSCEIRPSEEKSFEYQEIVSAFVDEMGPSNVQLLDIS